LTGLLLLLPAGPWLLDLWLLGRPGAHQGAAGLSHARQGAYLDGFLAGQLLCGFEARHQRLVQKFEIKLYIACGSKKQEDLLL
jgi:hypothetical protein